MPIEYKHWTAEHKAAEHNNTQCNTIVQEQHNIKHKITIHRQAQLIFSTIQHNSANTTQHETQNNNTQTSTAHLQHNATTYHETQSLAGSPQSISKFRSLLLFPLHNRFVYILPNYAHFLGARAPL